jgi:hypothetical protein
LLRGGKLRLTGEIEIPGVENFIPNEHFNYHGNPGNIRFGSLSNFRKAFDYVNPLYYCPSVLSYSHLDFAASDVAIISELGGLAENESICQIWQMLMKQPKGENGLLLTDYRTPNIFFVRNCEDTPDGDCYTVSVRWDQGWSLVPFRLGTGYLWPAGSRVFASI